MSRSNDIPIGVSSVAALVIGGLAAHAAITGSREAMVMVALLVPLVSIVLIVHLRVGLSPWLLRGLLLWMALEILARLTDLPWYTPTDGGSRTLAGIWIAKPWLTVGAVIRAFGLVMLTWFFAQALGGRGESRASVGVLASAACAAIGAVLAVEAIVRLAGTIVPRLAIATVEGTVDQQLVSLIAVLVAVLLLRLRVLPG